MLEEMTYYELTEAWEDRIRTGIPDDPQKRKLRAEV